MKKEPTFIAICQFCGKRGNTHAKGTPTGGTPRMNPQISGSCPSSPTGKHAPQWQVEQSVFADTSLNCYYDLVMWFPCSKKEASLG